MRRIYRFLIIFYTAIFFLGCSFAYNRKVTGRYHLIATDTGEEMCLSFKLGNSENYQVIVDQTVFAIGYNDKYIIAKQHPLLTDPLRQQHPGQQDKGVTNYFIVPIHQSDMDNGLLDTIGPLTLAQFNERRQELKIPEKLDFTIVLKDLE